MTRSSYKAIVRSEKPTSWNWSETINNLFKHKRTFWSTSIYYKANSSRFLNSSWRYMDVIVYQRKCDHINICVITKSLLHSVVSDSKNRKTCTTFKEHNFFFSHLEQLNRKINTHTPTSAQIWLLGRQTSIIKKCTWKMRHVYGNGQCAHAYQ